MKKSFMTAIMAVTVLVCSAQVQFSLFGGPQTTSSKYTINGQKQPTSQKFGFQVGGSVKVPFENKLYFSPSAFYSLKGYKVKFNQRSPFPDSLATDNNTSIHTFELAALLQYDFNEKPGHFFVKFGPSIDFQISGKERFNRANRGNAIDRKMVFSYTQYGRYAASLITQLGYETKSGLLLFAHYTHGIGSMNNADGGPSIWHRVIGFSIGKYMNKKK